MKKWILLACALIVVAVIIMKMRNVKANETAQNPVVEMHDEIIDAQLDEQGNVENISSDVSTDVSVE